MFSAGTGNFPDDDDFEEMETDEFIPAGADFAVHITGDSMMPMFREVVHIEDRAVKVHCSFLWIFLWCF